MTHLLIIGAAIAALVYYLVLPHVNRERLLRTYALENGLALLGTTIPNGLRLDRTSMRDARSIKNVLMDNRKGRECCVFDCSLDTAESSEAWTVVAIQRPPKNPALFGVGPDRTVESAGEWTLVCHRGLMSVDQIRDCLSDA